MKIRHDLVMLIAGAVVLVLMLSIIIFTLCLGDAYLNVVSVSTEKTEKQGDFEYTECGPMSLKFNDETLENGYVYLKMNSEYRDNGKVYTLGVFNGRKFNDKQNVVFQCNLLYFDEWTMCPLPYANQYLVVKQWDEDEYYKKLREETSYVPEIISSFKFYGVGDYTKYDDCFINKTVWVYWEDDSEIVKKADELRSQCKGDDSDFAWDVLMWIRENIEYDDAKTVKAGGKRPQNKYYELLATDNILSDEKGVCTDYSGLFVIMMRSQGIPCRYIDGYNDNSDEGEDNIGHAWNQVYANGSWDNYYDVTNRMIWTNPVYTIYSYK